MKIDERVLRELARHNKINKYIMEQEIPDVQLGLTSHRTVEVERTAKVMTAHELDEASRLILAWEPGQCNRDISQYMTADSPTALAMKTLCMAADQGDFSARDELGRIYYMGTNGVKPDLPRAYMWYSLAEMVYLPPGSESRQELCNSMTLKQRSTAIEYLKKWKPGICESELVNN